MAEIAIVIGVVVGLWCLGLVLRLIGSAVIWVCWLLQPVRAPKGTEPVYRYPARRPEHAEPVDVDVIEMRRPS